MFHRLSTNGVIFITCRSVISASNRIILSGTPIMNNLKSCGHCLIGCILDSCWAQPRRLLRIIRRPIMRGRQKDATVGQQRLGHDLTQNLRQLIKPFFLRRTKTEKLKLKHSSCAPYQSSSDRSSQLFDTILEKKAQAMLTCPSTTNSGHACRPRSTHCIQSTTHQSWVSSETSYPVKLI